MDNSYNNSILFSYTYTIVGVFFCTNSTKNCNKKGERNQNFFSTLKFLNLKSSRLPSLSLMEHEQMDQFVVKMNELGKENSELRKEKLDGLVAKLDGLATPQQEPTDRESQMPYVDDYHEIERHEDDKFVLVDNTNGAMWDTSTSQLIVQTFTAKRENRGCSIRSALGFPTTPPTGGVYLDSPHTYAVNYFEVTIDRTYGPGHIHVGLAAKNFPMDRMLGTVRDQFGIGINGAHMLFRPGVEKFHGVLPFARNDVVGCGIFTPQQKTKNGNELLGNKQHQKSTIFFTVNGEIMAIPIPLRTAHPMLLYPCVSLERSGDKVTANFGHLPFKYAIPPAEHLCICV